ncbi:MAG: NAD-dependent malic enzyme [Gammaproteobacteria bacterium]
MTKPSHTLESGESIHATTLKGNVLLENSLLNKGTAFTETERIELGLLGLLPPHIESLADQSERAYEAFCVFETDLEKHVNLRALQDNNETLFYRLIHDHLPEMMPIIYTPVVGAACEQFSKIYRRPRGLFLSWPERDRLDAILDNAPGEDVRVIVVTDGERILGLGDQGAGGMGIPIGKLSLYTACGGIDPATTLPIFLDVGTNNQERLKDPFYIGWRHERITGDDYYQFVDLFIQAVKRKWPDILLQFEDFAQTHATPLLKKYRDQLCTFNDDIQGTAAVTVGTLLAAVKAAGVKLCDQNVVFLGVGSAGCGIAEQIIAAMIKEGVSESEARQRIFMVGYRGLLHDGLEEISDFKLDLAQSCERVKTWASDESLGISLLDVIKQCSPSILIGVSGQPGMFTEEIIRAMAERTQRPMIFPLSNPTARMEATPSDLITWTEGKALVATGSPFDPVRYNGNSYPIAQCNNSYIFPGMGLGILAVKARRVTDAMFMSAAEALSNCSPALDDSLGSLLPPLDDIRKVSRKIAVAVALQAQQDGVADAISEEQLQQNIDATVWEPRYYSLIPQASK